MFCAAVAFSWSFPSICHFGPPLAVQEVAFSLQIRNQRATQRSRATHSGPLGDQMSDTRQLGTETERRAGWWRSRDVVTRTDGKGVRNENACHSP